MCNRGSKSHAPGVRAYENRVEPLMSLLGSCAINMWRCPKMWSHFGYPRSIIQGALKWTILLKVLDSRSDEMCSMDGLWCPMRRDMLQPTLGAPYLYNEAFPEH